MEEAVSEYLSHLRIERGSSPRTVEAYTRDLRDYVSFLASRNALAPDDVDHALIGAYEADLIERGYAPASVKRRVSVIKGFHRFCLREGFSRANPADALPLPKVPDRLPDVLSIAQVTRLLDELDGTTPRDLRDRAMLEVLYGCGLRVSELTGLNGDKVRLDEGSLLVTGKGEKQRIAPIAGTAARALARYLEEGRPALARPGSPGAVFLNARGGRLSRQSVHAVVARAGRVLGISNPCATRSARTCSKAVLTCASSRRFSVTPTSPPRRSTPTSTAPTSRPSTSPPILSRDARRPTSRLALPGPRRLWGEFPPKSEVVSCFGRPRTRGREKQRILTGVFPGRGNLGEGARLLGL